MSYCKMCGSRCEEDGIFCPNCGAKVDEKNVGESSNSMVPQGTYQGISTAKKKNTGVVTVIGIVAVVLIAMIFFVGVLGDDSEGDENSVAENLVDQMTGNRTLEIYQILQEDGAYPYTLSERAEEFLQEHEELFPTNDKSELISFTDRNVEYKHLEKNIDKYGESLFCGYAMYVIDITEEFFGEDECLTSIHVIDDAGNSYIIYLLEEVPNVYENYSIDVYGLPLGLTSFDNVGGGTTRAVVLAGCYVNLTAD